MNDDIRPKGTVQVRCSDPTCGWSFWIDALDSRLPDGPFICGANHSAQARFQAASDRLEAAGLHFTGAVGAGCGCSGGGTDDGPGAITVRLYDPALECRYEYGGSQDNYARGQFAVFTWNVLAELEQASLNPADYDWTDWETAWAHPNMQLSNGPGELKKLTATVLLLEEPDGWIALAEPYSNMREVKRSTRDEAQQGMRDLWLNPLPLRFPDDIGPTPTEFAEMQRYGVHLATDDTFTWHVLDMSARAQGFKDLIAERMADEQN